MKNKIYTGGLALFVALVILVPAYSLDARERGERQRSNDRTHEETHAPTHEPIVIPKEILEEWKEDLEEGNIDKVIEEFEEIVENGLPEPEPEGDGGIDEPDSENGEEETTDRRPRTRKITRDRGISISIDPSTYPCDPIFLPNPDGSLPPITPSTNPCDPLYDPDTFSQQEDEDDGGDEPTYIELVALEIHRLTNIEREKAGLLPFLNNPELSAIALMHSEYMGETSYFSHTTMEGCDLECRLDDAEFVASAWGENIAWRASSVLPSVEDLALHFVRGWINSPDHMENMMSEDFTHDGIGVALAGEIVFATVDFVKP